MVRLGCGHLTDRPVRSAAQVTCSADGRRFDLVLRNGVWEVREVTGR